MIACSLLVLTCAAGQTFTVDDNGPADFQTIQSAIDAAQDGDIVLIEPGEYEAFHLDKPLSLLGPAMDDSALFPTVIGGSAVTSVESFAMAGLVFEKLRLVDVPGRAILDDCVIDSRRFGNFSATALTATNCDQLQLTRLDVRGSDECCGDNGKSSWPSAYTGGNALKLVGCNAQIVDSTITSGEGYYWTEDFGPGGTAVYAIDSQVVIAACTITAGDAGVYYGLGCFGGCEDRGGDAIWADNSFVWVRGSGQELEYGDGSPDGLSLYLVDSNGVLSGVEPGPFQQMIQFELVNSSLLQPSVAEPVLICLGSDQPGSNRMLQAFGPGDAQFLQIASFGTDLFAVPGIEGLAWLAPTAILDIKVLVANGPLDPVITDYSLPQDLAGLAGLTLHFQALFPDVAGVLDPSAMVLSNATHILVRH